MSDSLIYDLSIAAGDTDAKPFLKKEMLYITDQNSSGNYSNSQVIFETSQLSNNGRWCDYGVDAYLSFPLMLTATMNASAVGNAPTDFTTGPLAASDYILALKNSNYNLIHSIQVEYSNSNVVQLTPFINTYLNFKLHSELSLQDEELNGPQIGYSKDTSTSWRYEAAAAGSPYGRGLCNNANSNKKLDSCSEFVGDLFNEGMRGRQNNYQRASVTPLVIPNGRENIYGASVTNLNSRVRASGINTIEATPAYKVYYYDAILRLKDLPFFAKLPLIRGCYMKITLNINQCIFKVTKDANGFLNFDPSSLSLQNGTNPLMVSASVATFAQNMIAPSVDFTVPHLQAGQVAKTYLPKLAP